VGPELRGIWRDLRRDVNSSQVKPEKAEIDQSDFQALAARWDGLSMES
jgi:hypothetical protein